MHSHRESFSHISLLVYIAVLSQGPFTEEQMQTEIKALVSQLPAVTAIPQLIWRKPLARWSPAPQPSECFAKVPRRRKKMGLW